MDPELLELLKKYDFSEEQVEELTKDDFNHEVHFEIDKAASNLEKGEFVGLGAAFGNEDQGGDIIERGAFKKTMAEFTKDDSMPGMFFNHKRGDLQVGEWLEMKETAAGLLMKGLLWVEGNPLQRAPSQEAELIRNSFLSKGPKGLSIGGRIDRSDPNNVQFKEIGRGDSKRIVRVLKSIILDEVSPVTYPMNKKAKIKLAKSASDLTIRQAENALLDIGFSAADAKTILSKGFAGLKRDADESDERDAIDPITQGQIQYQLDKLNNVFSKEN